MVSTDGVDSAITGEANKSCLVIYKQTEPKFIAMNKTNSITKNKINNVTTTVVTNSCRNFCNGLCSLSVWWLGSGIFVFSPAMNIQHNSKPTEEQTICVS